MGDRREYWLYSVQCSAAAAHNIARSTVLWRTAVPSTCDQPLTAMISHEWLRNKSVWLPTVRWSGLPVHTARYPLSLCRCNAVSYLIKKLVRASLLDKHDSMQYKDLCICGGRLRGGRNHTVLQNFNSIGLRVTEPQVVENRSWA